MKIMKIGPYSPLNIDTSLSKYEAYDKITRQLSCPGINSDMIDSYCNKDSLDKDYDIIITSTLRRGIETGNYVNDTLDLGAKIIVSPLLNEVVFSMHQLLSFDEYEENGSAAVRALFFSKYKDDLLLESKGSIRSRIESFVGLYKDMQQQGLKILPITHSFFMKCMEVHCNKVSYNDFTKKMYDFCEILDIKL